MVQQQVCAYLTINNFHNVLLQLVRGNAHMTLYDSIRLLLLITTNNNAIVLKRFDVSGPWLSSLLHNAVNLFFMVLKLFWIIDVISGTRFCRSNLIVVRLEFI